MSCLPRTNQCTTIYGACHKAIYESTTWISGLNLYHLAPLGLVDDLIGQGVICCNDEPLKAVSGSAERHLIGYQLLNWTTARHNTIREVIK